jgi:hypothetical protein
MDLIHEKDPCRRVKKRMMDGEARDSVGGRET